ncbi:hypothetical protein IAR55_002599 [Kwoniella newhampshirensis]|uniref:Transcription factor domain-containing protein n=1 Tax=Kwoniella newhampshirensis TaxID=1651941 RepID=A0AAW0Z221_9TREE
MPFVPPEDVSPIFTLTLDTLIKPQLERFFDRVYPMIPVFSRSYILSRLDDPESQQNRTFVALVLSMCALSLVHPLRSDELASRPHRAKQCKILIDEALRLRSRWDWGLTPRVQAATASYLMFGALFELGYADGARIKLKEAIGMGEALSLASRRGHAGIELDEARRRLRLFWILSVTERARGVTILRALGGSASDVFGVGADFGGLSEVQKADLLITWQWLRNRVWRLAAGHGLIQEEGGEKELSVEYIVDVAATTVAICQRLTLGAMEAHGCGFVEKLYDIAQIVTEVGQACPQLRGQLNAIAWSDRWMTLLQSLHLFVTQHRAGTGFAQSLTEAMSMVSVSKILSAELR